MLIYKKRNMCYYVGARKKEIKKEPRSSSYNSKKEVRT